MTWPLAGLDLIELHFGLHDLTTSTLETFITGIDSECVMGASVQS